MTMDNPDLPDVLQRILTRKHEEIAAAKEHTGIEALRESASEASPVRGFFAAIRAKLEVGESAVIAEIKKASPSKGVIRESFDPAAIAQSYERAGATCLSVLTDIDFFQGSSAALRLARDACALPVIRKDFMVESYQIVEARAMGADCVLLIVAALDDKTLVALHANARSLGMDVLIEVHDANELKRVMALGLAEARFTLLGINNRDLRNFDVSLSTTLELLSLLPEAATVVTESGILSPDDVQLMRDAGVNAFLVGEACMRHDNPGDALQALFDD